VYWIEEVVEGGPNQDAYGDAYCLPLRWEIRLRNEENHEELKRGKAGARHATEQRNAEIDSCSDPMRPFLLHSCQRCMDEFDAPVTL